MTQKEKQLLLNDLCGRLPYKPYVYMKDGKVVLTIDIVLNGIYINDWITVPSCQNMTIKPYLRPMSSMTEEEKKEIYKFYDTDGRGFPDAINEGMVSNYVDYCNAHHIDYRGLIEKGLALEAPEDMYKN